MTRPLVSIVCGTWQRHELLLEAIANAREQTYRPLEHVIVSDGPDPELRAKIDAIRDDDVPIVFAECGRNWTTFLTNSLNAVPFQVAGWLAGGDYIVWQADDERFLVTDYISRMVGILEETGADFAYPNVEVWYAGRPESAFVIGNDPPACGSVTQVVHRASLLDVPGGDVCTHEGSMIAPHGGVPRSQGGFRTHVGSMSDWDQFDRWMKAGKTWRHVPETLFRHRIDH